VTNVFQRGRSVSDGWELEWRRNSKRLRGSRDVSVDRAVFKDERL